MLKLDEISEQHKEERSLLFRRVSSIQHRNSFKDRVILQISWWVSTFGMEPCDPPWEVPWDKDQDNTLKQGLNPLSGGSLAWK